MGTLSHNLLLEVENYFYTEMEFYGVNCAIQYKNSFFYHFEVSSIKGYVNFKRNFSLSIRYTSLNKVWVKVKQYLHKDHASSFSITDL